MQAARSAVPAARAMAYDLRRQSGRLLFDPEAGKKQKHRVCHCGRSLNGNFLSVWRAEDGSRARVTGAMSCGSAWTCPICAFRVGTGRQAELSYANVAWVKAGGFVHLLTLTFPHAADEPLADLLAAFDKARQAFRNRAGWKSILGADGDAGCIGTVSSLEVTHGVNGWHPHLHVLAFVRRPLRDDEIERLQATWVKVLLKFRLGSIGQVTDMMEHALDVRGGADAAAYITKYGREEMWGMSEELTISHAKEAKGEHLKPFGLLRVSMERDDEGRPTDAARRSAALFREFADAFHGKRLLTWSPGLKEWFGIADLDDDALADDEADRVECGQCVGVLNQDQWRVVVSRNAEAELEDYAATWCGGEAQEDRQKLLDEYIEGLRLKPQRSAGWYWNPMRRRLH